jgi:protein gp37
MTRVAQDNADVIHDRLQVRILRKPFTIMRATPPHSPPILASKPF